MRLIAATTMCLVLSPFAAVFAADQPAAAPATTAAAATPDAAAKHAKRTTCRKEAAEKKLAGKEKMTYVKDCMAK